MQTRCRLDTKSREEACRNQCIASVSEDGENTSQSKNEVTGLHEETTGSQREQVCRFLCREKLKLQTQLALGHSLGITGALDSSYTIELSLHSCSIAD